MIKTIAKFFKQDTYEEEVQELIKENKFQEAKEIVVNISDENKRYFYLLELLKRTTFEYLFNLIPQAKLNYELFVHYFNDEESINIFRNSTVFKAAPGLKKLENIMIDKNYDLYLNLWHCLFLKQSRIGILEQFTPISETLLSKDENELQSRILQLKLEREEKKAQNNFIFLKELKDSFAAKSMKERLEISKSFIDKLELEKPNIDNKELAQIYSVCAKLARTNDDKELARTYYQKRLELDNEESNSYFSDMFWCVVFMKHSDKNRLQYAIKAKEYFESAGDDNKRKSMEGVIELYNTSTIKSQSTHSNPANQFSYQNIQTLQAELDKTTDKTTLSYIYKALASKYRQEKDYENSYKAQESLANLKISENVTREALKAMVKRAMELKNTQFVVESLNKLKEIEKKYSFKQTYSNGLEIESKLKGFIDIFDIKVQNSVKLDGFNISLLSDSFIVNQNFNISLYEKDASKLVYDIYTQNNRKELQECDIKAMMELFSDNNITFYEYFTIYPRNNRYLLMKYDIHIAHKQGNNNLVSFLSEMFFKEIDLSGDFFNEWILYLSSICETFNLNPLHHQHVKALEGKLDDKSIEVLEISKKLLLDFYQVEGYEQLANNIMPKSSYFNLEESLRSGARVENFIKGFEQNYNYLGAFKYLDILHKMNKNVVLIDELYQRFKSYTEELEVLMSKEFFPRENTDYRKGMIHKYILNDDDTSNFFYKALNESSPNNAYALCELIKDNIDNKLVLKELMTNNNNIIQSHKSDRYFVAKIYHIINEILDKQNKDEFINLLDMKIQTTQMSQRIDESGNTITSEQDKTYDFYIQVYQEYIIGKNNIKDMILKAFESKEYKKVISLSSCYFLGNEKDVYIFELFLKSIYKTISVHDFDEQDAYTLIKTIFLSKDEIAIDSLLFGIVFSKVLVFDGIFQTKKDEIFKYICEFEPSYDNMHNLFLNYKKDKLNKLNDDIRNKNLFIKHIKENGFESYDFYELKSIVLNIHDKCVRELMEIFIGATCFDVKSSYYEKTTKLSRAIVDIDNFIINFKNSQESFFGFGLISDIKTQFKSQILLIKSKLLDKSKPNILVDVDDDGIITISSDKNSSMITDVKFVYQIKLQNEDDNEEYKEENIHKLESGETYLVPMSIKGDVEISYTLNYTYNTSKGFENTSISGDKKLNIIYTESDIIDLNFYNINNKYFLKNISLHSLTPKLICTYENLEVDYLKEIVDESFICIDFKQEWIKNFDDFIDEFNKKANLMLSSNPRELKNQLVFLKDKNINILISNVKNSLDFDFEYLLIFKDICKVVIFDSFDILDIRNNNVILEKEFELIVESKLSTENIKEFLNIPNTSRMKKDIYVKDEVVDYIASQTNGNFNLVKNIAKLSAKKLNDRKIVVLGKHIVQESIKEICFSDEIKKLVYNTNDSIKTRQDKLKALISHDMHEYKEEFMLKGLVDENGSFLIKMFENMEIDILKTYSQNINDDYIERINELCKEILHKNPKIIRTIDRHEKLTKMYKSELDVCAKEMYIIFYEDSNYSMAYPEQFRKGANDFITQIWALRNTLNHTDSVAKILNANVKSSYEALCQKVLSKPTLITSQDRQKVKNYLLRELELFLRDLLNELQR